MASHIVTFRQSPVPALPQPTISAMARAHGVSRTTIRRWQARGWSPPVIDVLPSTPSGHSGHPWTAAILVLAGLGIGGLAVIINLQHGLNLAASPAAAWTLGGLAVATDVLALVLPAAAAGLWCTKRPGLAAGAWLVWFAASALAVMASLGFTERNVGDTASIRRAQVATADQRGLAIEAARTAVQAAQASRQNECQRRGSLCRDREADERAALQSLATAIARPIEAAPASDDPQVAAAVRLARWVGLGVTSEDVANLRLVLMCLVPNAAGIVMAAGLALRQRIG